MTTTSHAFQTPSDAAGLHGPVETKKGKIKIPFEHTIQVSPEMVGSSYFMLTQLNPQMTQEARKEGLDFFDPSAGILYITGTTKYQFLSRFPRLAKLRKLREDAKEVRLNDVQLAFDPYNLNQFRGQVFQTVSGSCYEVVNDQGNYFLDSSKRKYNTAGIKGIAGIDPKVLVKTQQALLKMPEDQRAHELLEGFGVEPVENKGLVLLIEFSQKGFEFMGDRYITTSLIDTIRHTPV